jgi:NAD(P)H-dependent FMN reductase
LLLYSYCPLLTLLVGTSRPESRTRRVAEFYATLLDELGAPYQYLDLTDLPADLLTEALYHNAGRHYEFNRLIAPLDQSDKLVIFAPEYNCSIPGALKTFIDALPYPGGIRGKKAALVALSSGSQGGLLALSHLTDILFYLGTSVLPQRVRLPNISQAMSKEGEITDPLLRQVLREQAEALLAL